MIREAHLWGSEVDLHYPNGLSTPEASNTSLRNDLGARPGSLDLVDQIQSWRVAPTHRGGLVERLPKGIPSPMTLFKLTTDKPFI